MSNEPAGRGSVGGMELGLLPDPLAPLRPRVQAIHKRLRKIETSRRRARSQRVIDSLAEELFDLTCELDLLASTH